MKKLLMTMGLILGLLVIGSCGSDAPPPKPKKRAKTQEEKVNRWVKDLNDPDTTTRGDAASILGRMGDKSAVPHLISALNDGENYVRTKAAEALVAIGDKSSIPTLIDLVNSRNKNARELAAWTLREITGQQIGQDHNTWMKWWRSNQ